MLENYLVDLLCQHGEELSDVEAVVIAGDGVAPDAVLTYAELDRAARSTAVQLSEYCRPADRVLLLHSTGLEFVKSLVGCLYAGVIPVPAPLLRGPKHHLMPATGVALDADVRVVLTDSENLIDVLGWMSQDGLDDMQCVVTDVVAPGDPGAWVRPSHISPDTLALLVYPSSSVVEPRGIMMSHDNISHDLDLMRRTFSLDRHDRFGSWLPMHNRVGLMAMLLGPLFLGSTSVQLSTVDPVARPYQWLEFIDQRDIHVSYAPSVVYGSAARRVTDAQLTGLDLSRWRHAFAGTTPVHHATLMRFSKRFAPTGFRPEVFRTSYGVAEATLFVAGTTPGSAPKSVSVDERALEKNSFVPRNDDGQEAGTRRVASSGALRGLDARIIEPTTGRRLPDGRVGEIWVRGRSVARGYWRKESETEQKFNAVTADGDAGFLRTGDLGVCHDGELYVIGSIKDRLVVNGRNLYLRDIECAVGAVDEAFAGLAGTVFVLPGTRQDMVMVQEIDADGSDAAGLGALANAIRVSIGQRFAVRVSNVVFIEPGKVPKTIGGSFQRSLVRALFVANALDTVYEELDVRTCGRYRTPRFVVSSTREAPSTVCNS